MFNKQNFCHIASNNRNEVKVGVFVYKTTDDLATVTTSGYFNDKIVDINLHDLIIHEWHDATDRTKVQRNVLCVTERTLDNVGTQIIKTDWEEQTDETLEQLATDISGKVSKSGDTMTNPLKFILLDGTNSHGAIGAYLNGVALYAIGNNDSFDPVVIADKSGSTRRVRAAQSNSDLGNSSMPWRKLFVQTINNGSDLAVPNPGQADTLGLKSEIDLAANSGRMITDEGVWYAKMDAQGTIPAEAEVEGRNYADFTQVDGNNDPIIVIYTYTSGAWTQTETITPPAAYDGYVPVTSKIWDIPEQTGQQGGRILWNHQSKEFTPYPLIVSFQDINVTGDSTVAMPATPSATQIVNKNYVDTVVAGIGGFDLFDTKWRDATTTNPVWLLSDGNWKTNTNCVTHLTGDISGITATTETYSNLGIVTAFEVVIFQSYWYFRYPEGDDAGGSHPYCWKDNNNNHAYTDTESPTQNTAVYPTSTDPDQTASVNSITNDITIEYYLASDGHKVVDVQYESRVSALYTATGVAWYYILDEANQRFKLPRTQHAFVGFRDEAGGYVAPGLPNITGVLSSHNASFNEGSGAFTPSDYHSSAGLSGVGSFPKIMTFNASDSNSIYGNSTTVQPPATQMFLYFYIGQ